MPNLDRLEALLLSPQVTGLDFIFVGPDQKTLDVHFLKPPSQAPVFTNFLDAGKLRIFSLTGGETLAEVTIQSVKWVQIEPNGTEIDPPVVKNVLRIVTKVPGDFSRYALHVEDSRIDAYFNNLEFTFKANCKSYLDCKPRTLEEDDREWVDFPVDYQARDFWSFRRALLDFASQRYPDWQDRLEADAGVMLAETMSALADEMAYYQDRVGRETALETASQRRSVRAHVRLVDYNIYDGLGAVDWLDVKVKLASSGTISAGTRVCDLNGTGVYEIGRSMQEALTVPPKTYSVDVCCNEFLPHWWDETADTLPAGSTHLYLQGAHHDHIILDDPTGGVPGKWMLLQERPDNSSERIKAWMVRVTQKGPNEKDPVFQDDMVRIEWEPAQALPFDLDLTKLVIHGNLVPISTGECQYADPKTKKPWRFAVRDLAHDIESDPIKLKTLEREGANGSVAYRFSLPDSDQKKLVWLGNDPRTAQPEVNLCELQWDGAKWVRGPNTWSCQRTLVGVNSSQSTDAHYVLEDGTWQRVAGYHRMGNPEEIVHEDYHSDEGFTLRFGDGEFGKMPNKGMAFELRYRLGKGKVDNVLANTLCCWEGCTFIESVAHPFDIAANLDPEPASQIRQLAPEEFRAVTFRAVRPEDYAEAAERLDWVQRAGGAFRYTGSWLSAFVTPDPLGTFFINPAQRADLEAQLNRFRQAGRETYVMDPVFATLDLIITLCVEPSVYIGDVEERVLNALLGMRGPQAQQGFFSPDRYTFGTPLVRSQLEKALQDVPGVRTVLQIQFRRRGWFEWRDFTELVYRVGDQEVIRVENDRFFPERGSVKLEMKGGA